MNLFPAIDLRGDKVVRLTQGDYDRMTVYGEDPHKKFKIPSYKKTSYERTDRGGKKIKRFRC